MPESWPGWTPATWQRRRGSARRSWRWRPARSRAAPPAAGVVRLVGEGVARRRTRRRRAARRRGGDADPAHVTKPFIGPSPPAAPARDEIPPPVPSSLAAPVPAASASPSRSSEDLSLRVLPSAGVADLRGRRSLPCLSAVSAWCRRAVAAAGPAPETGGGTEEVPKAGPGGGPPPTRNGGRMSGSWPTRGGRWESRERASEATRRRPMSRQPGQAHARPQHNGSVPAQYSPVCTLVTFGTAGATAAAGGGRVGEGLSWRAT